MTRIIAWNIRGLNWPRKQEDVKAFLHLYNVSMLGLLETKVKKENERKIAVEVFPGWRWLSNSNELDHGRIWLAWNPTDYHLEELHKMDQLIHCLAWQIRSNLKFHITYVYGRNHTQEQTQLWSDLSRIANNMTDAWCVLGDFNAVLSKEDREGGDDIHDYELKPFVEFLDEAALHELRWKGQYFTWSNRTVRSRIDRVLVNDAWYGFFDFSETTYLPMGLSDHTPMMVDFLNTPMPKRSFKFCDMWVNSRDFHAIVEDAVTHSTGRGGRLISYPTVIISSGRGCTSFTKTNFTI